MAFNDSFDDSLGAIMIFLILMMSVFLYLSIHMISKTNATIPLADDHNFGGHNLDSKLDLESNMPEITNLTLNDRLVELLSFLNWNFFYFSTLGCGPTGDQLQGDHTLESIKSAEVSFISKQDFQLKTRTPKQQSSPKPKQSARPPRPSSRYFNICLLIIYVSLVWEHQQMVADRHQLEEKRQIFEMFR